MKSYLRYATNVSLIAAGVFLLGTIVWTSQTRAHEYSQVHRRLTIAAFELFRHANPQYDFVARDGISSIDVEFELGQGAIDEDLCIDKDENSKTSLVTWGKRANFFSHFTNPTDRNEPLPTFEPWWIPKTRCNNFGFDNTTSRDRARELYDLAVDLYREDEKKAAYRVLGRVLHLLEDKTSQAHVHHDPHGHPFDRSCGHDIDDFERWGWCPDLDDYADILDYFRYHGEPHWSSKSTFKFEDTNSYAEDNDKAMTHVGNDGEIEKTILGNPKYSAYWHDYWKAKAQSNCDGETPPPGFTCRLWEASKRLYDGKPQGGPDSLGPVTLRDGIDTNIGGAFVRRVAEITYDFTTFSVRLSEDRNSPQPDSELNRMLRPFNTGDDVCSFADGEVDSGFCEDFGNWQIFGPISRLDSRKENAVA